MAQLTVYSAGKNPRCERLRTALTRAGVTFREVDINNPEAVEELRNLGFIQPEPPVIRVVLDKRSQWVFRSTDIFRDGRLIHETLSDILMISRPQTSWPY